MGSSTGSIRVRVAADAQDEVGHLPGDTLHGHDVGEQGRGADDEQGIGGGDGGVLQALLEGGPVQRPVQEQGDEQGIDHGNGGGLGGGEPTQSEAGQDDQRRDQGGDGVDELLEQVLQVEGMALIFAHDGKDEDHHHQQDAHQQAGDHTAHEQLVHADAGYAAIDDQGDRGREDGTDHRGGGSDRAGELLVIAVLGHGLHLDGAQTAGVGYKSGSLHLWTNSFLCPGAETAFKEGAGGYGAVMYSWGRNNEYGASWKDPAYRAVKISSLGNVSTKLLLMDATDWQTEYEKASYNKYYAIYGEKKQSEGASNTPPRPTATTRR